MLVYHRPAVHRDGGFYKGQIPLSFREARRWYNYMIDNAASHLFREFDAEVVVRVVTLNITPENTRNHKP